MSDANGHTKLTYVRLNMTADTSNPAARHERWRMMLIWESGEALRRVGGGAAWEGPESRGGERGVGDSGNSVTGNLGTGCLPV